MPEEINVSNKIDEKLEAKNKEIVEKISAEWRKKYGIYNNHEKLSFLGNNPVKVQDKGIEYKKEWNELRRNHGLEMGYFAYRSRRVRHWKSYEDFTS